LVQNRYRAGNKKLHCRSRKGVKPGGMINSSTGRVMQNPGQLPLHNNDL
jgi:hypothetical protein